MRREKSKVRDLRSGKFNVISPAEFIIPEGVTNTLLDIVTPDGKVVGNIEIGSDGFIQAIILTNRLCLKLYRAPDEKSVRIGVLGTS